MNQSCFKIPPSVPLDDTEQILLLFFQQKVVILFSIQHIKQKKIVKKKYKAVVDTIDIYFESLKTTFYKLRTKVEILDAHEIFICIFFLLL